MHLYWRLNKLFSTKKKKKISFWSVKTFYLKQEGFIGETMFFQMRFQWKSVLNIQVKRAYDFISL